MGRSCLLPPILEHQSFSEAHFHPLTQVRPLLLHTHTGAPFTSSLHTHGLNLTLYTSLDCQITSLRLRIDWWGTIGRAGARYWAAVPAWAVGIVTWLTFTAVSQYERGGRTAVSHCRRTLMHITAPMPSVSETLSLFTRETLPRLLGAAFVVSLLPLPQDYVLGNGGEVVFALLAPLILLLVTGMVTVSWWTLCIIILPIHKLWRGRNLTG